MLRAFCSALCTLILTGPALAHKLNVTVAPVPPDRLRVEAGYDDGTPADGATAVLTTPDGVEMGRGTLDDRGVCELARPAGGWVVTVDDGAGHRASARFDRRGNGGGPARWLLLAAGLLLIGAWVRWRRLSRR